jgi:hypothetical protein
MTINTVSSTNAAAAAHAQQQTAGKHKSTVDFAKLMANASGDIKTDTNSATKQSNSATAIVQNGDGTKAG